MAVYTEVSFEEAKEFLAYLKLGNLQHIQGCHGGIENTNYFVNTEQGEFVLTLFERLTAEQLPYYLHLMKHLALRGIAVPDPAPDPNGDILHSLNGKPAAVVNKLQGKSHLAPGVAHCEAVAAMLARMHLAGLDFDKKQANLRGLSWWNETVPVILPYIDAAKGNLLKSELAYQNHIADQSAFLALPRGPIHADLFRDNVMFALETDGSAGSTLTGFFDFYFAGNDSWLFDIAVTLNDWCIDLASGQTDVELTRAFLDAYERVRPLTQHERQMLPAMARAAALRFWISRLWDFYLPREASVLKAHDPGHFERVLRARVNEPLVLQEICA